VDAYHFRTSGPAIGLKGITRLFVSLTVMAELSGGVLESIPLNINAITDSHFIRNWALNLCH
jgi:hypothetical protein